MATLLVGTSAADIAPIAVLAAAAGWVVAVALPNPDDRGMTELEQTAFESLYGRELGTMSS